MPILKHAKKKLKQDVKRTTQNRKIKDTYKSLVKKAREENTPKNLSSAFSAVDKAAKKNVLSKNKAAHLKSSLVKHVPGKAAVVAAKPKAKKAVKKVSKTSLAAAKAKTTSGTKKKTTSK